MRKQIKLIFCMICVMMSLYIIGNMEDSIIRLQSVNNPFCLSASADSLDRSVDFNSSWKFIQGDVGGAESADYDDINWKTLDLPHDWSIAFDFNLKSKAGQTAGFLDGGTGWYRKKFALTDDMKNKRVAIDFDGVMTVSTVYVNGSEVGQNFHGYTEFSFDITDYLKDGENVIAVKVSNRQPSSRWYTGSGIYRNVKLTVTDLVYVDINGTYITTPTLEEDIKCGKANVSLRTDIVNENGASKEVTLKTQILDADKNIVAEKSDVAAVDSAYQFSQKIEVKNPQLWSVDNPYLYTAVSNVIVDGVAVDTCESVFGMRYMTFDANNGFALNGEHMKLKGVCLHHDLGSLGAAENTRAIERQIDMMKAMGANAIRSAHNPASKTMVELCNQKGMMLIEEGFDMWSKKKTSWDYSGAGYFKLYAENDIKKMVDRDKNDPCVIMWSIGNEITYSEDNAEVAQKLVDAVKSVDTTRPTTINENHYTTGMGQRMMDIVDVVGYSYAPKSQTANDRENHPDWILFWSETGSHMESRGVYYSPTERKQVDFDELQCTAYDIQQSDVRWGHTVAEDWTFDRDNKYVLGGFIWTGFDYIGEPTPYMNSSITDMDGNTVMAKSSYFGMVDTAGFPKDSYYLYQSQWTDEPMVHILPHWNWSNGEKVQVWAYTNADSVELFLNGKSLGVKSFETKTTDYGMEYKETSDGKIYLSWEVPFEEGELKAIAKNGEEVVAKDTVKTAGSAQAVRLTPDRRVIDGDGRDLSFVTVDIVDNQGNIVPDADNLVNFEVTGGIIAGVDNGNAISLERYQDNKRKAFNGKALVIVKSDKSGEPISVTAKSSGLADGRTNVYLTSDETTTLLELLPVSATTQKGTASALPDKVTAVYSDGSTAELAVTWDSIDSGKYNTAGSFTVNGNVVGTDIKATATVYVIDIVAIEPFTDIAEVGRDYTLPETVNLVYSDSSKKTVAVTWDSFDTDAFDKVGLVEISGTVAETNIKAKAVIRVVSIESGYTETNVARDINGGKAVASFTHSGDNVNHINDGTVSYTNSPKNRWSNYLSGSVRADDYVGIQWETPKIINSAKVYFATSSNAGGTVPDTITVTYINENNEEQEIQNVTKTDETVSNGTITTLTFDDAAAKELRINMTNTSESKCLCVTEIEVNGKVIKAYDTAKLSDIKINGTSIKDFNDSKYSYSATFSYDVATPEVTAVGQDNASVTVVALSQLPGIYKILVKSESGLVSAVYSVDAQVEKAPLDTVTISAKTALTEDDTEDICVLVVDKGGRDVTDYEIVYTSSNNKIISVKDGRMYALSEGTAQIYATVKYLGKSVQSNALDITVAPAAYTKTITGFEAVNVTTDINTAPKLPQTVTANYDKGLSKEVNVTWDRVNAAQYTDYGKFTVRGTVDGTNMRPVADVEVAGIVAVQNVSVGTITYEKPSLPDELTVYYSNGKQEKKAVVWNDISPREYAAAKTFTAEGVVEGTAIKAKASVRVTDEYENGLDLSARKNGYDYPLVSASYTYSGDNLENICDEVISYTNNPKNRWSDYRNTETAVYIDYVLGYESETEFYIDDVTIHYFMENGSSTPNTMQIQYWDGTEWKNVTNQNEESEQVTGDNAASGVVTSYTFDKVSTSRLRFNMTKDSDKHIAITEIKFYSDYMEHYDTAVLADIKADGQTIAGFDEDTVSYTIDYEGKIPEITAIAADNAAVTVVPATSVKPETKIIVTSESEAVTRTYTVHMNNITPEPSIGIRIKSKNIGSGEASYNLVITDIDGGEIIAASYNSDGTLYALNSKAMSDGSEISVQIPVGNSTVKIMLWNSLSGMEPLCCAVEDTISQTTQTPEPEETAKPTIPPVCEKIPDASTTYSSISILWDKPEDYRSITGYNVYMNGELSGTTAANETYYTVENLTPDTEYIFVVTSLVGNAESEPIIEGSARTDVKGTVRDITEYGAVGDSTTLDTNAIQSAIDACEPNDIVLIPENKTFLTGALDLKSDMTLEVNGTLLSSKDPADFEKTVDTNDTAIYTGGTTAGGASYNAEAQKRLIWSRIEGWEQYCYRSLINVGYLTEGVDYGTEGGYVCENVKIIGAGTITGDSGFSNYPPINGNATALAVAEGNSVADFYDIDASATDSDTNNVKSRIRGRLINVSNARNVYIKGVTVAKPPCWTIHMIYSDNVVTNGVDFQTKNGNQSYRNGDGWDPDSSSNCTIYNSTFNTGDDCVAIKSGKNPEGNKIGRPAKNIKVIGCASTGGLGLAVGSEMSGGVEGVYVRDCNIADTRYGIEIKANKVRGGYVKDFHVQDTEVGQILIHSVTYNGDGAPADASPVFSDMSFKNMKILGYNGYNHEWLGTSVTMEGFTGEDYYIQNIAFNDIVLGTENNSSQNISMTNCRNIAFNNVRGFGDTTPSYSANDAAYTIDGNEPPNPTEKAENSVIWDFAKYTTEVKTTDSDFTESYNGLTIAIDKNGADSDHDKITTAGVYWRGGASSGESAARYIEYTTSADGVLCARGKTANRDGAWGISTSKNVSDLKSGSNKSSSTDESTVYMECKAGETYYIIPYRRAASVYEVWFTPAE